MRGGTGGYWYMATFTPPGDPEHSMFIPGKRGKHGPCNCGKHGLSKGQWNAQESACWNRLRTALSRQAAGGLAYVSSVEVQEGAHRADGIGRDMLHRHALIWSPAPLSVTEVHGLALSAGYGCSIQWQRPYSGNSAAHYVAKYITKSAGQRGTVPWEVTHVNEHTGEITARGKRATYRTWSRSQKWGVSIQELRDHMAAQARNRARYLDELAQLLDQPDASAVAGPALDASVPTDPP